MPKKTVTLDYTKSTKQTFVYTDNNESPLIPTLYVRRSEMPKKPPQTITVSVEYSEDG